MKYSKNNYALRDIIGGINDFGENLSLISVWFSSVNVYKKYIGIIANANADIIAMQISPIPIHFWRNWFRLDAWTGFSISFKKDLYSGLLKSILKYN
jgi:hypothetical protein